MISPAACQLTAGRCGDDRPAGWLWLYLGFLCRLAGYMETHPGGSRFTGWLARRVTQELDRCRAALTELAGLAPGAVDQALAIIGQLPGPAGRGSTVRDEYGRQVDLVDVGRGMRGADELGRRAGFSAKERAARLQVADQLAAGGPRLSGCVARWWWATLIILARRLTQGRLSLERVIKFFTRILAAAAKVRYLAKDLQRLRLLMAPRWRADTGCCPGFPGASVRAWPPCVPRLAGDRTGKAAPMTG